MQEHLQKSRLGEQSEGLVWSFRSFWTEQGLRGQIQIQNLVWVFQCTAGG